MSAQGADALFIKKARRIHRQFHQGRPDQVAGKNINPAEVTVSSILSKSILVFDVKTTADEARLKMQKKFPLRHKP
jgi:hypothetical protein